MIKPSVFNVYISKNLIKDIKIKDVDQISFVKQGISWGYFFFGFNVVFALRRGFKLFALLLCVSEVMFAFIVNNLPSSYAMFCNFCFSFFVLNIAPDMEEFFAKQSGKTLVTHIVAKNFTDAQIDFFTNFYPVYLKYLSSMGPRLQFGNNYYFNLNEQQINSLAKEPNIFIKIYRSIIAKLVELKNTKISISKRR